MKLSGFWNLSFICLMIFNKSTAQEEPRVVCYYSSDNINPNLCTHLIYKWGSVSLENDTLAFDDSGNIVIDGYAKFNDLKASNKNLKTLLSIGGSDIVSRRFSSLVGDADKRRTFAKNAIIYLRQNHFDGFDLNFQNPTLEDYGKPTDRENYAQFVKELRVEFDRESSKTKRPRLLLTIGIPADIDQIKQGYDVVKLNQYLDWFNLLSYHTSSEQFMIAAGADRQKLVFEIPTYGRSFKLSKLDATGIGLPANGPGDLGKFTEEELLEYYKICEYIKYDDEWTVVHPNNTAMHLYLNKDDQWIVYVDENIARKNAQYAANNGFSGIVFWSIDMDDFTGSCSGKPYPIIEAAKKGFYDAFRNKSSNPSENKVTTVPHKPTQTTTVSNEAVTSLRPNPTQHRKNTKSKSVYRTRRPPTKLKIHSDGSEEKNNSGKNTFVGAENDDPQQISRRPTVVLERNPNGSVHLFIYK